MIKLALSRCAYLAAAFGVCGALLLAGPGWHAPPVLVLTAIAPMTLGVLVALGVAAIGGGLYLMQAWSAAPCRILTAAAPVTVAADARIALTLLEQRADADAVAVAVRIFEDGLIRMRVTAEPTASDASALIASVARRTSLMALKATVEAARTGAIEGDFAAAAAKVRDLARRAAHAADAITLQVARIAAATDQAQGAVGDLGDQTRDLHAMAARIAAGANPRRAGLEQGPDAAKSRRLGRAIRAA